MKKKHCIIILSVCGVLLMNCKKTYNPPAVKVDNKFLVIDGTLINSADSPSVISLSRTVKLTDTTQAIYPETGALVSVEDNAGVTFNFFETPNGVYRSAPLSLNTSGKYRLKITTSSGSEYASDFVEVKQSPPIDSVTWQQQNDVMIYVNTHDPANNAKYYRWDFSETWQYQSTFNRSIAEKNGLIYYVDSTTQTYNCWSSDYSTNVLLQSTVALSQDVISNAPIALIPQNSEKIGVRYSILVKQYSLTEDAYQYFQILKKNTENLGSIFDAQPTQLIGNIHSLKKPDEIVIGYFTVSSVQQQRIFIRNNQLLDWKPVNNNGSCDVINIPQDPGNYLSYNYNDPLYVPYYFGSMPDVIYLAKRPCVDCTARGGTTNEPAYW